MKRITSLIILCLTLSLPVSSLFILPGCATPQQTAFKSADAVISSVDIAMRGWADYVVKERRRIKALAPIDQGSQSADLLRKEGRVHQAYGRYQASMRVAHAAVNASLANGEQLPQAVGDAASAVLNLVQELKKP